GGRLPRPGALFRLPGLANTYDRVLRTAQAEGSTRTEVIDAALRCWYQGFVAKEIDAFYRNEKLRDSSGEVHGGLLRYEDMAAWSAGVEAPVTLDYGRYTVAKCGFWSQGPVFLQQLGMLRHAGLEEHAPHTAAFVHRLTEAAKLAMADRLAWYGDAPAADRDAQAALLTAEYLRSCWELAGDTASAALLPGRPLGRHPLLPDLDVAERTLRMADARFGIGEPTFAALP